MAFSTRGAGSTRRQAGFGVALVATGVGFPHVLQRHTATGPRDEGHTIALCVSWFLVGVGPERSG